MGSGSSQRRLTARGALPLPPRALPSTTSRGGSRGGPRGGGRAGAVPGPTRSGARRVAGHLLWSVFGAGLFGLILAGAPICPSAGWLGVPCPGCGLTRAALHLARGDLSGALRLHPLVPVVIPAIAWLAWTTARSWLAAAEPPRPTRWSRAGTVAAASLVFALLLVWVLRFLGFLGGPAPVTTYMEWWSAVSSAGEGSPRGAEQPD